jgi:hypothetical protein
MLRLTIQKIFLTACIGGVTAATTLTGHAGQSAARESAARTATHQTAKQGCHKSHRPAARVPAYMRYLDRARAVRPKARRG